MRLLTLFPKCENVHLIKDVGMIPFTLQKIYNYDVTIASYDNGDYPYLITEVKGIKQKFIKKIFSNPKIDSIIFLIRYARNYDILQVYHFSLTSILHLFLFKCLNGFNPTKKTYLKLDADDDILKLRLRGLLGKIMKMFLAKINLVTIETSILFSKLNKMKVFVKNLYCVPNGFFDDGNRKDVNFEQKDNLIITVGRIGTFQKSNEILLDAFAEFYKNNRDWKLELIGSIEPDFKQYIRLFFISNPDLVGNISFTGSINDRVELAAKYKKAKIFVLTSKYEGFPLVFLEAIRFGCTIISSDVTAAYDITNNGMYGKIFDKNDPNALRIELENVANDTMYMEANTNSVQKFAYNNFYWPTLIKKIHEVLIS